MLVMSVHQTPSLTEERYEEVVRRLTNGNSRLESPSDLPFDGLLVHMAGQGKNGFWVVDVFESEEAVDRFNQALGRSRGRSVSNSHQSSSRHTRSSRSDSAPPRSSQWERKKMLGVDQDSSVERDGTTRAAPESRRFDGTSTRGSAEYPSSRVRCRDHGRRGERTLGRGIDPVAVLTYRSSS